MVVAQLVLLLSCSERVQVAPPQQAPELSYPALLERVVSPSGRVHYDRLLNQRGSLDAFVATLAEDPGVMSDDALLARRINAYNAFVLQGVLENWPLESVQDVSVGVLRVRGSGFFAGQRFKLDGEWISLYTLEHDLIRERFQDARVHAALNCASMGCPPLRGELWSADGLDEQLDDAMRRFVSTSASIGPESAQLSELFDWFEDDFTDWDGSENVCHYLTRYDPSFQGMADQGCPSEFIPYDWSLNATKAPTPLHDGPAIWPNNATECGAGMVLIPGGTYTTGMKAPQPYGVVDTTQMEVVDHPERLCDGVINATDGATACWVQTDLHDPMVPLHDATVDDYCIERLPFPGAGAYSQDGMSTWDAARFDELLASGHFGPRRMCTYTEYELAVAGPTQNLRFVYGDQARPARCEADEEQPIGSRERCVNPETGLMEYGAVISQWVVADTTFAAHACPQGQRCRAAGGRDLLRSDGTLAVRYIVAGGTRRVQTRQAPYTPHTWHDHGEASGPEGCDDWGWDDGPAVCGEPDERYQRCPQDPDGPGCQELAQAEARWQALVTLCRGQSMTSCINRGLSEVRGEEVDICPGGPSELGPGQGR